MPAIYDRMTSTQGTLPVALDVLATGEQYDLDGETILVTAQADGEVFIDRAQAGTAARAHSAGASLSPIPPVPSSPGGGPFGALSYGTDPDGSDYVPGPITLPAEATAELVANEHNTLAAAVKRIASILAAAGLATYEAD